ncbi:hypothetical protein [Chryseobacterium sp. JK1]|uniref:hypothetical protein n=1 Tax=Chryseobacterium sp. JK1 TaxID=874294 RepID=UPI003D69247D
MKKTTILLVSLFTGITVYSQVGINTNSPKATLDVTAKATDATAMDGLIAPRLTGAQLRSKTYTADQTGALVYVTAADTAPAGQTINVTKIGYFYFDGTKWVSNGTNTNLYNSDGTITGNRIVSMNSNILKFSGTDGTMKVDNEGESEFYITALNSNTARTRLTSGTSDLQIAVNPNGNIDFSGEPGGTSSLSFGTPTGANPSSQVELYTLGLTRMSVNGIGNVGIATTNQTETLDNNGITRLRSLPLNGATNAIHTQSGGSASPTQNQTFTATRTVVADANGVLGYVTGLPSTGSGTPPSGSINVGETISQIYTVPIATANTNSFNLGNYITTNSLPALPIIDGLQINMQGVSSAYYDPRIYNVSSASQLISFQSFATQVNQNRTSLNNTVAAGNYLQIDSDNLVYWTTSAAEVETANVQVQIDANTYRWYEFKWWCMEISSTKKIFLSITRKA